MEARLFPESRSDLFADAAHIPEVETPVEQARRTHAYQGYIGVQDGVARIHRGAKPCLRDSRGDHLADVLLDYGGETLVE